MINNQYQSEQPTLLCSCSTSRCKALEKEKNVWSCLELLIIFLPTWM